MSKISILAVAFIFTLLILTIQAAVVFGQTETVPLWGPYLTAASETSMTVNWRTENATTGTVFYATENYFNSHGTYDNTVNDSQKELHHVQLTGLISNTTYHYRLLFGDKYTADRTFTTFGSNAFTFIVYGDSQEQLPTYTQLERHKLVADRIATENNVAFILHCGDLVGDVDNSEEWNRFFQCTRSVLAEAPIFPVLGNHEQNSTTYYDTFGVPEWYSFDCSNAHFTMLDGNFATSAQAAWLADDLSGNATWKFAVFHQPPYSSTASHWGGWLDLRAAWEPEFIANNVSAVFNGHVHAYERYYENNIDYLVLGIGGGPSYKLADDKIEGYRNSLENTLGYARVTVNGGEASVEIIKVADVSSSGITYVYPPNTVFEKVNLSSESLSSSASLTATANLVLPMLGIDLDRSIVDYGDIMPGENSSVETVGVTNIGTIDCKVTLEVKGANSIAQDFYKQALYVDNGIYDINAILASIPSKETVHIDTQLRVPSSWNEAGLQQATFVFWAEAS
jgi:predicted phosphodiesterase